MYWGSQFRLSLSILIFIINQSIALPSECQGVADTGNCDKSLYRYYYDIASGDCQRFIYTGCDGNSNRFIRRSQCREKCLDKRIPSHSIEDKSNEEQSLILMSSSSSHSSTVYPLGIDQSIVPPIRDDTTRPPGRSCSGCDPLFGICLPDGKCGCKKGFKKTGRICIDLDECEVSNLCPENAICINTLGGFTCNCGPDTICDALIDPYDILTPPSPPPPSTNPPFIYSPPSRPIPSTQVPILDESICTEPFDVKINENCGIMIPRFYYESMNKECRAVLYGGCKMTSKNIFMRRKDCESLCIKKTFIPSIHSSTQSILSSPTPSTTLFPPLPWMIISTTTSSDPFNLLSHTSSSTHESIPSTTTSSSYQSIPSTSTSSPSSNEDIIQSPPESIDLIDDSSQISVDTSICTLPFDPLLREQCMTSTWSERFYFDNDAQACVPFWYDTSCDEKDRKGKNYFESMKECQHCLSSFDPIRDLTPPISESRKELNHFTTGRPIEIDLNGKEEEKEQIHDTMIDQSTSSTTTPTTNEINEEDEKKKTEEAYLSVKNSGECSGVLDSRLEDDCNNGEWEARYYFSSEKGKCRPFWWGGCEVDVHNFYPTQEACKSSCGTFYPIPSDEYFTQSIHERPIDKTNEVSSTTTSTSTTPIPIVSTENIEISWTTRFTPIDIIMNEDLLTTTTTESSIDIPSHTVYPIENTIKNRGSISYTTTIEPHPAEEDDERMDWNEETPPSIPGGGITDPCDDPIDTRLEEECSTDWEKRAYFDAVNKKCVKFWYGGCEVKSRNLFLDSEACRAVCHHKMTTVSLPSLSIPSSTLQPSPPSSTSIIPTIPPMSHQEIKDQREDNKDQRSRHEFRDHKQNQEAKDHTSGEEIKDHKTDQKIEDELTIEKFDQVKELKLEEDDGVFEEIKDQKINKEIKDQEIKDEEMKQDEAVHSYSEVGGTDDVPQSPPIPYFHSDNYHESIKKDDMNKEESMEEMKISTVPREGLTTKTMSTVPFKESTKKKVGTITIKGFTASLVTKVTRRSERVVSMEKIKDDDPMMTTVTHEDGGTTVTHDDGLTTESSTNLPTTLAFTSNNDVLPQWECLQEHRRDAPSKECGKDGRNWTQRYYFDHTTRSCRMFWGCSSTILSNNFPDLLSCQWKCEPIRAVPDVKSCLDKLDPTLEDDCNGGKFVTKFHFDFDSKKCVQFHYGGCRSPSRNIFDGAEECKNTCERPDHTVAQSCMEAFDRGFLNTCNVNGRFEPKYFYDSTKGKCEMFWWGGCRRGASNFFASLETCKWSCERPKKSQGPRQCHDRFDKKLTESCQDGQWRERFHFDHETSSCVPFWWDGCFSESANFFRDYNSCEALCMKSEVADIDDASTIKEEYRCLEPKKVGDCRETYPAYYYDRIHRECRPFSYSGCGGNGNRFLTIAQCNHLCKPFTLLSEVESSCYLPLDTGHSEGECGKLATIAWHFDRNTGTCAEFWFRGCEGNGNRFNSLSACNRVCISEHRKVISSESIRKTRSTHACFETPTQKGVCPGGNSSSLQRYSYLDNKCVLFTWSGCGGTNNRFHSLHDCEKLCKGLKPSNNPEQCSYDADWGPCNQLRHQWFFNQSTGFCGQFLYGGCGGNANRFDDFKTCQKTCEVSGEDVCTENLDRGKWCEPMSNRYHYHKRLNQCKGFHYTGCGNSNNNFKSLEECQARCVKTKKLKPRTLDTQKLSKKEKFKPRTPPPMHERIANDREERAPKGKVHVATYINTKPIEKTQMKKHIILEGNGTTYHKTQSIWVDHNLCFAYRYNVTGTDAKLETHLCAKESSEDCWSELMSNTNGDELCHIVKPFLKGTHKYTWFFSLIGGSYVNGKRSKEGLTAVIMVIQPSHCHQIC